MKMDEKIFRYFDNQMSEEEKSAFENELKIYPDLQKDYQKYKSLFENIDQLKNIEIDGSYLIETIPKFRARQAILRKFKLFPRLTLSLSTLVAVVLVFVITFSNSNKNVIPNNKVVVVDSSGVGFSTLLDPSADRLNLGYISSDEESNYDSLLNSMITKELDLSPNELSYISPSSNSDLSSLLQNIDEKDADNIYKEVLNKRILGR
ncbi:MAG: hypothetical protein ACYCVH_16025 [Ignavibacteriaceae bacterium]